MLYMDRSDQRYFDPTGKLLSTRERAALRNPPKTLAELQADQAARDQALRDYRATEWQPLPSYDERVEARKAAEQMRQRAEDSSPKPTPESRYDSHLEYLANQKRMAITDAQRIAIQKRINLIQQQKDKELSQAAEQQRVDEYHDHPAVQRVRDVCDAYRRTPPDEHERRTMEEAWALAQTTCLPPEELAERYFTLIRQAESRAAARLKLQLFDATAKHDESQQELSAIQSRIKELESGDNNNANKTI